ncbi:MAG: hypothetical protein JXA01_01615 [Dehalococcoidia bacterium]|nr:hypothetical protein [Dehalococcoidia bacterium]
MDGFDTDGVDDEGSGLTTTVVDAVDIPLELTAFMLNEVDLEGDTTRLPETSTWPMPWFILTEVAPLTFHCSVDVPPALMTAGLPLNTIIIGAVSVCWVDGAI